YRCRRAIAVLTPEFLESSVCAFCTRWAHYLGIEHVQRKLIPLCLRPCATPLILQGTNVIDYTKAEYQDWEYLRLVASLKVVPETTAEAQQASTSSIKISI
ncbi:Myeloid differentiation primary response protein MyD88, partial [Stegodyphus mimosarum]